VSKGAAHLKKGLRHEDERSSSLAVLQRQLRASQLQQVEAHKSVLPTQAKVLPSLAMLRVVVDVGVGWPPAASERPAAQRMTRSEWYCGGLLL
jgi:hypothetical protein